MNWRMYVSFAKWLFMKAFGGAFNAFERWRELLRTETPLAIIAFVVVGVLYFIVVAGLAIWLFEDRNTIGNIMQGYLAMCIFAFLYNVFKTLFEIFKEERQEIFDTLKK
jgi:amino acid permease